MEAAGVALDRDGAGGARREFGAEIDAARARDLRRASATSSTSAAPSSSSRSCSTSSTCRKGKRTKTGYSTDASVLEELRRPTRWSTSCSTGGSTRSCARPTSRRCRRCSPSDGRLHTTFHQAVAATGRLSSSDPNLQNIPIRTALGRRIRRAFVAGDPDVTLLAADYSQIELRILAHVSGDEHLKDAFARGADIHRETAARVLHKDARRGHRRRALDGQDGQLRARLRDERLRPVDPGRHPAQGGPGLHQHATSRPTPASATTCSTSRRPARQQGYVDDAARAAALDPRAPGAQPEPARRPASGWPSTCRSRARPPTS